MTPAIPAKRLRLMVLPASLDFFAAGAGRVTALRWGGGPAKQSHIARSAGGDLAASSEFLSPPGAKEPLTGSNQTIPERVSKPSPPCFLFKPRKTADCALVPSATPDKPGERYTAGAGRYQPTYYALVGWPLKWWTSDRGHVLLRLVSAALSVAFLAAAMYSVLPWSWRPFLLAGLLVATTPLPLRLVGVINPNRLEIAATIAIWAALISVLLGDGPPARRLLILAGVSAVTVAGTRRDRPSSAALAPVIQVGTAGGALLGTLARYRGAWILRGTATVACLLSGVWMLTMKSTELVPVPGGACSASPRRCVWSW